MFKATFLGWQSWLLASDTTRLLVDPVLIDQVGRGGPGKTLSFHFWPPREWDWSKFPSVHGILLSHEHEDHFNIPTLARVDRSVPIWLSARSSIAIRTMLAEMGFEVQLVYPGEVLTVGDLSVELFSPLITSGDGDEWDTLGYLVRQAQGEGTFFTNVDVPLTTTMREAASRLSPPDDVLTYISMTIGTWAHVPGDKVDENFHKPATGIDYCDEPAEALRRVVEGEGLRPLPGQTAVFEGGRLRGFETRAPFLGRRTGEERSTKSTFWNAAGVLPKEIGPLTGQTVFPEELLPELERELQSLAEYLYGGTLFRLMYSMSATLLEGRRPTFVIMFLADDDDGMYVYEYVPQRCNFVQVDVERNWTADYLGGVSCWASDFLAVCRGEFESRAMNKHISEWWPGPLQYRFINGVFWPYFHPLRHPDRALAQYRTMYGSQSDVPCLVRRAQG